MRSRFESKKWYDSAIFVALRSNPKAMVGMAIMVFFVLVAVVGPLIFPYDAQIDYANYLAAPSWNNPLGTDGLGRDVFRQLIAGTGDVLTVAALTAVITITVGVTLGLMAGLLGKGVDRVITLIANVFLTIPSLPVFLILAALFTVNDPFSFALILSLFNWAGLMRAIRAQIISLRERDFIQICTVMKMSKAHIIIHELIPNIASYILINFILVMKNALTGSVGIMFLGLAAFEPTNWGAILITAKDFGALFIPAARIWLLAPIVCIFLFQLGIILLSSGLDEALNPRLRKA